MDRSEDLVNGEKVVRISIDGHAHEFKSCDDCLELIDAYELNICPFCQGVFDEKHNIFVHGGSKCH